MAVHIQVNSPDLKLDENCVVHSMPCKINHDGQANVSGFFSPYIENKELDDSSDGVKQASFRGYPLQGKETVIPDGFKGIVVTEMKKPLTDIEERNLVVSKKFDKITYWNWDCFPVNNDSINQSMDWLTLSKMIHETE
ncbi:ribonuclease H2 subunit C-like [Daphnia pulicaria]|uniref:ribonuclease H2 subunit C-like n=1 Tax=Daphnia pulicaria TaxID=35523 RepID=UPI001EE9D879|nr:ribonuclease H2 subunit C-like [Daphnia pulicaria]